MKVTRKRTMARWHALLAAWLLALPAIGWACCPSDGHTAPKAATGLGDVNPPSADLAGDPLWQVYEFERDGVRYVQVNDATGKVRAAAGRIANTFWVMPIGTDAGKVSLPGDAVPTGTQRVLYRGVDVEVVLIEGGAQPQWLVRPPSGN